MMMAGLGGTGRGEKETENKTGKIQPFGAGGGLGGARGRSTEPGNSNHLLPRVGGDHEMRGFPPS